MLSDAQRAKVAGLWQHYLKSTVIPVSTAFIRGFECGVQHQRAGIDNNCAGAWQDLHEGCGLTEDDIGRPSVIFEKGYFYGMLEKP